MEKDRYITEAAAVLRLPITAEMRPGVAVFFEGAAELAALLETVPLDDSELVLAPVFRLPETKDG